MFRISVIIPVLNEADNLVSLIPWLRAQGGDALGEILVIDAMSTDSSVACAKANGAIVIEINQRNRAYQMNLGADTAQFDILYFVHADTLPPEHYGALITHHLDTPGKMGCFRYKFRSDSLMLRLNSWFTRFGFLWCQGGDKTFFIRKSCFEDLGKYNAYYSIMEEYDFLQRALRSHQLDVLPHYATVSARKYEQRSWLRVQVANLVVFNGWRLGVQPAKLMHWYKTLLQ
jgi:rSAM/selenodomain-associated transferase 2